MQQVDGKKRSSITVCLCVCLIIISPLSDRIKRNEFPINCRVSKVKRIKRERGGGKMNAKRVELAYRIVDTVVSY